MSTFQRAIPGQSLTDEPKNYPWERPPEVTDPNEAVLYHLDRVTDPDVIDNVFQAFDFGLPVKVLTDSMMTAAVGKGIHSVDLGLLVEPVIRKAVMKIADQAGVEYKEDFEDNTFDNYALAVDGNSLKIINKENAMGAATIVQRLPSA